MSDNVIEQLENVKKGKACITDVIREINLAKKAFARMDKVEHKMNQLEKNQKDLAYQVRSLVPKNYLDSKFDAISSEINFAVKACLDKYTEQYSNQLNDKVGFQEVQEILKQKTNSAAFNKLSEEVSKLGSKIEKHIKTDFEGFKAKMKIDLSQKKEAEASGAATVSNEELTQLKSKVAKLEEELQGMMMDDDEEMFSDEEDFESEEGDIIDNLEQNIVGRKSQENDPFSPHNKPENNRSFGEQADMEEATPGSRNLKTRGSSRQGGTLPALSRVGSRASTGRFAGNSAIRQVNKKLILLEKDFQNYQSQLENANQTIQQYDSELQNSNLMIQDLQNKLNELALKNETLEENLQKAIQSKATAQESDHKEQAQGRVPHKVLEKFKKDLENKAKRIILLETRIEKLNNDNKRNKDGNKDKLSKLINMITFMNDSQSETKKELNKVQEFFKNNYQTLQQDLSQLQKDVSDVKGPLTEILSEQQRENEALTENVRMQLDMLRSYMGEMSLEQPTASTTLRTPSAGARQQTPGNLTLKQRFHQRFKDQEGLPISGKLEENWWKNVPEGKTIYLPRFEKSKMNKSVVLNPNTSTEIK